jgi:hypothetical protein
MQFEDFIALTKTYSLLFPLEDSAEHDRWPKHGNSKLAAYDIVNEGDNIQFLF